MGLFWICRSSDTKDRLDRELEDASYASAFSASHGASDCPRRMQHARCYWFAESSFSVKTFRKLRVRFALGTVTATPTQVVADDQVFADLACPCFCASLAKSPEILVNRFADRSASRWKCSASVFVSYRWAASSVHRIASM